MSRTLKTTELIGEAAVCHVHQVLLVSFGCHCLQIFIVSVVGRFVNWYVAVAVAVAIAVLLVEDECGN